MRYLSEIRSRCPLVFSLELNTALVNSQQAMDNKKNLSGLNEVKTKRIMSDTLWRMITWDTIA